MGVWMKIKEKRKIKEEKREMRKQGRWLVQYEDVIKSHQEETKVRNHKCG